MSTHHRMRRRSHQRPVACSYEMQSYYVWFPDPDEPIILDTFAEAAGFALDLDEFPVANEAIVLLDERRRVTAMLLDPPAELGVFVGCTDLPGAEVPFCQTMSVMFVDRIDEGPPTADEKKDYVGLRRAHALQGLLLLDVIMVAQDLVRSLAIACDPDPIWFEPFEPLGPLVVLDEHNEHDQPEREHEHEHDEKPSTRPAVQREHDQPNEAA